MLVQIQGLSGSLLVGFALNQLSEINEAFSVTTGIDGFILVAALLATKLMKPSEPHHVYGYAGDCNTANYSSVPCNSLLDSYNSPGFYSPLASQAESTLHTNKE